MNVTAIINSLPVVSASISNNYQKIPYVSNTDIIDTCPWFTDPDGDTLVVSIIKFDNILGKYDSNTITVTKCACCLQHYCLRVYNEQYQ